MDFINHFTDAQNTTALLCLRHLSGYIILPLIIDFINRKKNPYFTMVAPSSTQFWRSPRANPVFALTRTPHYLATVTHAAFPSVTILLPSEALATPVKLENINQRVPQPLRILLFFSLQADNVTLSLNVCCTNLVGPRDLGLSLLMSIQVMTHSFASVLNICWISEGPCMLLKLSLCHLK